jgi:branched-chain amino acid transport system substrate-binding protein
MEDDMRGLSLGSIALVIASGCVMDAAAAEKKYESGVSDTEIKIGQSVPYSGPYSVYGQVGKAEQAYFAMLNAEGGINGSKIKLISLDDGYVPPKALEQTRRLVEEDGVFFIFGSLGPAPSMVVRRYLNPRKIPQLWVWAGDAAGGDYQHYPWTISWSSSLAAEARLYAEHILENRPNAKIAVLWLNDEYGRDYLKGFKDGLGERAATMIVAEQTYESTDPTVDSQTSDRRSGRAGPCQCR